ncbi:uncharacterized protein LOC143928235 [Lithobates pipiens]
MLNFHPHFSLSSNSCTDMERLNGEMAAPPNGFRRFAFRTWFIWSTLFLLLTSAMFSFCFFSHHRHSVNDLCDACAIYNKSSDDWEWNLTNCHEQLKSCNTSTVCIKADGIYLIDIQIYTLDKQIPDIELETSLSKKHIVAGSYGNPKNSSYVVLRANLVLKKEDKIKLKINGNKAQIMSRLESTYWKILKLRG